jgi:DNA repair protein RadC
MSTPIPTVDGYRLRLLTCVPVFSTRLVRESAVPYAERLRLKTPSDAARLLRDYFADKDREEVVAVLLDPSLTVIGLARVSVGGLAVALIEPAQVFKAAILANAGSVILAHNHPSGNPEPSHPDIVVTEKLVAGGEILGIRVHDHLIVTADGHTSLAERGLVG